MQVKYSKKLDPRYTKPFKSEDLDVNNKKFNLLAKNINLLDSFPIKKCLICDSKKLKDAFFSRNFMWSQCSKCNHLQKKQMPLYEDLLEFYNQETVENYLNEVNIDFRLKNLTIPKYKFIIKNINKNINKNWLDLASGLGDMPYYLKKNKWKVTSTEIYNPFIEFAKDKLGVSHTNMLLDEYYEFHKKSSLQNFSVVGALGYFDILPDPLKHAKIINNLLVMGGTIAVNIPINDSVSGIMSEMFPDQSLRQITPMDYSVFSKESIFKMLQLSGFEITAVWYHGLDFYEIITKLIQNKKNDVNDKKIDILLGLFNDFQKVIDKNKMSDLLLICGKKIKEIKF
tara:strand:- start:754 stop:1776 length:1023 start_codon:yes stop_codon:yes gene_type:complete